MEKINFSKKWNEVQNSPEFQKGRQEFLEGKLPKDKGVKCSWYKAKVSIKEWNDYYSKTGNYTFLSKDGKDVWVGFLAVGAPDGCLEITNIDDLMKIDAHRRATNHRPFVFDDKN